MRMVKQTRVRHRMSFDYLEGFLEVARVQNFSRAAAVLYRTQPTLSQQIQRLEREFGGKLFKRDFKAVRLTQAGATLRRYAEELLALRTEALEAIGQIKQNPRGSLRIGTNDATCLYVLPNALAGFRRLYPLVQVNIYRNFSHKILEQIQEGNLEIGIVSLPRSVKGLEFIPIFSAELKVLVPSDHPLAEKPEVTPADISFYPLLLPKTGRTRKMIDDLLRPYKKTLQISMELASVEIIKKYVSAGIGISLLPEAFAQTEVAAGTLKLVPLQGKKHHRELGLVYRRGSPMSLPAKAFLDIVQGSVSVPTRTLAPPGK
ncbi:MAG: LysR family transcriptional regulator [Terriglobia bacterium]|jgi:DNA-binding transcriptional LysR family regulator